MTALSLSQVSYQYPDTDFPVVKDVTLQISRGMRFGLFGPNGAGKTTLMSLMTGILTPQKGEIKINDITPSDTMKYRRQFGYVPQDFAFYPELTPAENLEFFGAWLGLDDKQIKQQTHHLLNRFGLWDVRNKAVSKFSGGMKRRVNIAIGVMNNPSVLFLDEPTTGVDVQSRIAITEFLLELSLQGTTLIYTSHQLKEAEALCDYIALIDDGKIIACNTLSHLLEKDHVASLEDLFLKLTGKDYRD
ncbi:MAG: ABC transporter ATP-binding protein [Bacteroidia bacterium]|nr:ABC transporter ATP-binding protein [Bacteroidia bacterium]MCE7954574.1 ABC transporter ATP-binding protein [Bacteroidetes bacterium CHB6]